MDCAEIPCLEREDGKKVEQAGGQDGDRKPEPEVRPESDPSTDKKRSSPPPSDASRHPKKQKMDYLDQDGDEGEGDNLGGKASSSSSASKRRLACPFFKHRPTKTRPSCVYPGFQSIARLKEHLYRQHMLSPYKCPRCLTHFKTNAELREHSIMSVPCEVTLNASPEGITPEQEKALKSKKRTSKSGTLNSDEEKWRDIYMILFPGERSPSPYCDVISVPPQYEDSLRRDLLARVDCALQHELRDLGDSERLRVTTIILRCHDEAFSRCHQEGPEIQMFEDAELSIQADSPASALAISEATDRLTRSPANIKFGEDTNMLPTAENAEDAPKVNGSDTETKDMVHGKEDTRQHITGLH